MLDTLFSSALEDSTLSFSSAVITIGLAIILGLIISLTYMKTNQTTYSQSFTLTMVVLPVIVAIIILLIGSNIARAFSLAGAFSIIRFRSAPGDPKDIAYVLFTMASGLACGVGAFGYAVLFTVILCVLMFVLSRFNFGGKRASRKHSRLPFPRI